MRRFLIAILLVFLATRPAFGDDHEDSKFVVIALGSMVTAQAAEFGGTLYLLGRCDAAPASCHIHEANKGPAYLISHDPVAAAAIHGGISFAAAYVVYRLHPKHQKLAGFFATAAAGSFTAIALRNRRFINQTGVPR